MTNTDIASSQRVLKKRHARVRKRREPWKRKAERHGVSTRTLDRWVALRIIDPPEYIRGRKYGDADEQPRLDTAA
jgi:hypothetical protein